MRRGGMYKGNSGSLSPLLIHTRTAALPSIPHYQTLSFCIPPSCPFPLSQAVVPGSDLCLSEEGHLSVAIGLTVRQVECSSQQLDGHPLY